MLNSSRSLPTTSALQTTWTVGTIPWRRWEPSETVIPFGTGEFIRVREHVPSVVAQIIGGPLPEFVTWQPIIDAKQDAELLILRSNPADNEQNDLNPRFHAFKPDYRFIIADQALDVTIAENHRLHPTQWISADAGDVEIVAEALALYLTGELMICADWMDLILVIGGGSQRTTYGRAIVFRGMPDTSMVTALSQALNGLTSKGFLAGMLLMQLSTPANQPSQSLQSIDDFATAVLRAGPEYDNVVLTWAIDASCDALVAIAFARSAPIEPQMLQALSNRAVSEFKIDS